MKKSPFFLAGLLILSLFVTFLTDWGLPRDPQNAPAAAGEDGTVYFADNNLLFSTIYGLNDNGEAFFFYREFNQFGKSEITQLTLEESSIYFLRETEQETSSRTLWEPVRVTADGVSEILGGTLVSNVLSSSMTAPSYISALDGTGKVSVSVIDASDGSVLLAKEDFSSFLPLYASYSSGDASLLVMDAQGTWNRITGSEVSTGSQEKIDPPSLPRKVSIPLNIRLACKAPFLGVAAVLSLIVGGFLILIYFLIRHSRKLATRMSAVSGLSLLASLAIIVGIVFQQSYVSRLEEHTADTAQMAQQTANSISSAGASEILTDSFYSSSLYPLYSRLLSGTRADLLSVQNGESRICISFRHTIGSSVTDSYPSTIREILPEAISAKDTQSVFLSEQTCSVAASPVLSNGVVTGIVVVENSAQEILMESARLLFSVIAAGIVILIVLCILFSLLLWRMTAPLSQLQHQMDDISEGRLKMERLSHTRDELGQMAKSIQEMCMGLSIRDYEIQSTLKSYGRFIPRDLPELLGRASVMEVSFGDVRSLSGNVAALAVVNRDKARITLEDAPFVDFVNQCFAAANHSVMAHGGYILSSGFEMGLLRLYFPGKSACALTSALDLVSETKNKDSSQELAPKFLFLLHHTTFLYGVAGSDQQAFPFLSSNEMEFLSSYSHNLADAGCQIVFTHEILDSVPDNFHYRYIGYVTDPASQESYKLYELLDAYSELDRNLRLWYDKDFQEAIQLFYRSDFYLARTSFSNILRSCPDDGVAKWYLFACEYYFQSGTNADFQLFSIDP